MGKDEVASAAVNLKAQSKLLLRHGRAFDVPPGSAPPPWRLPGGVLTWLLRLPQSEIDRIALTLRALHPFALIHLAHPLVGDLPVWRIGRDREIDVPVHRVGVSARNQVLDQPDDWPDGRAGERLVVRSAQAQGVRVGDVRISHLARQLFARDAGETRRVVDLVVDVGDVRDERDLVAFVFEEPLEQRENHVRPRVPDMDAAVHGRAAHVNPHLSVSAGDELAELSSPRVVQQDLAQGRGYLSAAPGGRCAAREVRAGANALPGGNQPLPRGARSDTYWHACCGRWGTYRHFPPGRAVR